MASDILCGPVKLPQTVTNFEDVARVGVAASEEESRNTNLPGRKRRNFLWQLVVRELDIDMT